MDPARRGTQASLGRLLRWLALFAALAAAWLSIGHPPGPAPPTVSSQSGSAPGSASAPPPSIERREDSFARATPPRPPTAPGQAAAPVSIEEFREGGIVGRVVDPTGRPVAGAEVEAAIRVDVLRADDLGAEWLPGTMVARLVRRAVTDEGGRFVVANLPPTTEGHFDLPGYLLTAVDGTGRVATMGPVLVQEGRTSEVGDLVLRRGAVVEGRVLAPGDRPVAGAQVFVGGIDRVRRARTDASGAFRFDGLPAGRAALWFHHQDYIYTDATELLLAPGATAPPRILMARPAGTLSVEVRDEDGRPVAGAWVFASVSPGRPILSSDAGSPLGPFPEKALARTDEEGRARPRPTQAEGSPRVGVFARGFYPAVGFGWKGSLRLEMEAQRAVRGLVVEPGGRPVGGAAVELLALTRRREGNPLEPLVVDRGRTDAAGRFSLHPWSSTQLGLASSFYRWASWFVRARSDDGREALSRTFGPDDAVDSVPLVLGAPRTLEVEVAHPDGTPAARAEVELIEAREGEASRAPVIRTRAITDADGRTRIRGVPPGRWQVRARVGSGAWTTSRPFVVDGSSRPGSIRLRLRRGAALDARVVDMLGDPLPGARVLVLDGASPPAVLAAGVADEAGRVRLAGLSPGSRTLWVAPPWQSESEARGWAIRTASTPSSRRVPTRVRLEEGRTLEVELPQPFSRPARLSGRVLRDGEPLPGALVSARVEPQPGTEGFFRSEACDGAGRFEFEVVPPGRVELRAAWDDLDSFPAETLILDPGAEREVELSLASGVLSVEVVGQGAPVAHAEVRIERWSPRQGNWASLTNRYCDERGRVRFAHLPVGRVRVIPERWGWDGEPTATVEIRAGGSAAVRARLFRRGWLQVQLRPPPEDDSYTLLCFGADGSYVATTVFAYDDPERSGWLDLRGRTGAVELRLLRMVPGGDDVLVRSLPYTIPEDLGERNDLLVIDLEDH